MRNRLLLLANPAVLHRVSVSPVLLDNFSGTGVLTAHTPDIYPVGSSWAIIAGTFGSLSGGYLPYVSGTYAKSAINCGLADCEIRFRARYYTSAAGAYGSGISFRSNSTVGDTYGAGTILNSSTDRIGWTIPSIQVHASQTSPFAERIVELDNLSYYTWKIVLKGASARLYDSTGVLMLASQTAAKLTNTYVGAWNQAAFGSWDFIEVKPLTKSFLSFSVMGDSISNDPGEWPGLVSCNHNNGYTFNYNHAVNGAAIYFNMALQTTQSIADNADFTICALGTNDNTDIHALYETKLLELWNALHKPIYALGVLPKTPTGTRDTINGYISAAVTDAVSAGANVTYWNTDGWIDPATDTSDGLHPNFAGHAKIAAEVLARI